jgi:hypothetical protein
MTFKEATDRLLHLGITAAEIADALRVSHQFVRRMRAAEGTTAYRNPPPPDVWRPALAALATARAADLQRFADEAAA